LLEESSLGKAVLLDLDGVAVELVDHFGEYGVSPRLLQEVRIVGGLSEVLENLVGLGFIIVGITNQPDIARGKITPEFLDEKHAAVQRMYPQIQDIFVCTHTETDLCDCRKPKPGLLRQAAKKYNIDFAGSWVIGDSRADIEAGTLVHARTIFLQTPYNCADPAIDKATTVAPSTLKALKLIVDLERGRANQSDS